MMDAGRLWRQRLWADWQKKGRYWRYMLNSHLLVGLLIVLAGLAVGYERWAAGLPRSFPYPLIAAVVFGWAASSGTVRTLFCEADLVFLLPAERQLRPYIQRAFWFSLVWHVYGLCLLLLLAGPLHARFSPLPWPMFLLILTGLKLWNLWAAWRGSRIADPSFGRWSAFVRFSLAAAAIGLVLASAPWPFLAAVALCIAGVSVYVWRLTKGKGWKWERLIRDEQRVKNKFYRLASMFVDVPGWQEEAKRRRWLDPALRLIPYGRAHVFFHLYVRTFFRAGGYAGLYIRLTVIGGVLLAFIGNEYAQAAIVYLFLYATALQLAALFYRHRHSLWPRLYPVPSTQPAAAAVRLLFVLLLGQNIVFHLVLTAVSPRRLWVATWFVGTIIALWAARRHAAPKRA
ncbi:ABC transporter permease [Geobacillus sp. YF-1]|uniref:ABC transporter permease n=1 Tax=Geobacillus sp. YF-1 TaxID=3457480 RepID=UPI0040457CB1